MKPFLLLALSCLFFLPGYAQFHPFISGGYSSSSERQSGLEAFCESAMMQVNGGQTIKISQTRRGFNVGAGVHTTIEGDLAPYFRVMANYSRQGGTAVSLSNLVIQSKSNALDITAGLGLRNQGGATFYALLGPSFYNSKMEWSKNLSSLTGTYTTSQLKLSYGLGVAYFGHRGGGVAIDALCNFSQSHKDKYFTGENQKRLPTNYPNFATNTNYSGPYLSQALGYIRLQITLFFGMGGK